VKNNQTDVANSENMGYQSHMRGEIFQEAPAPGRYLPPGASNNNILNRQLNTPTFVIPDLIRDPETVWIPVSAGMTLAMVINCRVNN